MIFIVSVIFFLLNRRSKKVFLKYLICFGIFAIVISPLLIQRDNQFGDPLYMDYSERIFIDDYYEKGMAEDDATALNYIETEGTEKFISRFVIDGSLNVVEQTIRLSAPYLLVLVPFGLVLSFRVFHQDSSYVKANWIMLILYGAFMVPVLATLIDRRFLFALLPPLIIFAVIPIQRLVEYGLSTFSFSPKNRNIFFVVILCIILLSTVLFMDRFERKDLSKANEDLAFANVLFSDLDSGHIFDPSKRTFEHGYLCLLYTSDAADE